MATSNFISTMDAVQTISILSYLNTLSDFLFVENYLRSEDQFQSIPAVNALYIYFYDGIDQTQNHVLENRKINLARELIKKSDLYGANETEILEMSFVDSLFKHIITSIVFAKFTNIYVFIAQVVLYSDSILVNSVYDNMMSVLSETTFLNENGSNATLETLSVYKIFQDFIEPLFPMTSRNLTLISVDYIFAQAGAMFHYSKENSTAIRLSTCQENDPEDEFKQYLTLGLVLHQSINNGTVNESTLQIFSLPAFIYYVYTEKKDLDNVATIITNASHWNASFSLLFSYINETFVKLERARDNDFRLQFHMALSTFKHRTTLAREILKKHCLHITDGNIEEKATDYMNKPQNYECEKVNRADSLPNLNDLFSEQVDNVTKRYSTYEKERIREIFGVDFLNSMGSSHVEIRRGFYETSPSLHSAMDENVIDPRYDMLRFNFPNGTNLYYVLLRSDNNISLMRESDDPIKFRKKLHLDEDQEFFRNRFPELVKKPDEGIDTFLDKIVTPRSENFAKALKNSGYDETNKEWWINFGLSLIPFYLCGQAVTHGDVSEAVSTCGLDLLMLLPILGEVTSISYKFLSLPLETLLRVTGGSLTTLFLRRSMQETSLLLKNIMLEGANQLLATFSRKMFQDLAISVLRFIDPGFELIFNIGKLGIKGVILSVNTLQKSIKMLHLDSVINVLERCENLIGSLERKINDKFGKALYVKSLSNNKDAGYGFRYVHLPNDEIAELRTVVGLNEKRLVVFKELTEEGKKIYNSIDPLTGAVEKTNLHLAYDLNEEYNLKVEFKLKNVEDLEYCSSLRRKRSPTGVTCLRIDLRNERQSVEDRAVNLVNRIPGYEIPEEELRTEIRKYIFPTRVDLNNFVLTWGAERQIPTLFDKYKIHDPELFSRLRYDDKLDDEAMSYDAAISRIKENYPAAELESNKLFPALPDLNEYFRHSEISHALCFEDYYGLKLYKTGFQKMIGTNTKCAQSMREALYRFAIRQSDDPIEEYAMTLYREEKRPGKFIQELIQSGRKVLELDRFTSVSESLTAATKQLEILDKKGVIVSYKMKFSEPYLRAKMNSIFPDIFEETVLLPGSKFQIDTLDLRPDFDITGVMAYEFELSFMHDAMSKEEWYKHIMDNLHELKEHGAAFYKMDMPSEMLKKKKKKFSFFG